MIDMYREAAAIVRHRLYQGERGDAIREAVEHVLDLAPEDHKNIWRRWLNALQPGHRIVVKRYGITVIEDVDPALVEEIESVFTDQGETS